MEIKLRSLCLITFIVMATYVSIGNAQDSSCLNKLAPCLNYLNGTQDPPHSCCDPLKSLIKSDAACLCSLASNRGTRQAEKAGINIDEAQNLPGRCGQYVNPLSCLTNSHGSTNSATKLINMSWLVMVISVMLNIIHMLSRST